MAKKTAAKKAAAGQSVRPHAPTMAPKTVRKSVSMTRRDIAEWKSAVQLATSASEPRQYRLQDTYSAVMDDALLTSQVNNRAEQSVSAPFEMVADGGSVDDAATEALRNIPVIPDIFRAVIDSELYGYSLIELSAPEGIQKMEVISRRNTVPDFGRFYPDAGASPYIDYRRAAEFGKWVLEFNSGHAGILNKAVPHVLFKKFAQSCWSELCEIFGIPPRYMKTNTQDAAMLDRAEVMMRELGAAAWFIIDTTEEFQFAEGVKTDGNVYANLIRLCNSETSMLISGAIIGQDTEHGNYSKEKVNMAILDRLVESDRRMIENYMNAIVIPALYRIEWMPVTASRFRFSAVEDTDRLWTYTKELLSHKDIDNKWISDKFGIPVKDKTFGGTGQEERTLAAWMLHGLTGGDPDFFDFGA